MQFRVVIPDHVKSGQYIRIHCPDGTEAEMRVPKGLKPGDSFFFDISDKDSSITIANDVQSLVNQAAANASKHNNNNNSNTTSTGKSGTSNTKNDNTANHKNNSHNKKSSTSFLDREVLHFKDFLVALAVGLLIGMAIVFGFVLGVLSATSGVKDTGTLFGTNGVMGGGGSNANAIYQFQSLQQPKQPSSVNEVGGVEGGGPAIETSTIQMTAKQRTSNKNSQGPEPLKEPQSRSQAQRQEL